MKIFFFVSLPLYNYKTVFNFLILNNYGERRWIHGLVTRAYDMVGPI